MVTNLRGSPWDTKFGIGPIPEASSAERDAYGGGGSVLDSTGADRRCDDATDTLVAENTI